MTPNPRTIAVTLDSVCRSSVRVELPVDCPSCGQSFDEDGALREEGYIATNQPCSLVIVDGDRYIDGYEASDSVYDLGLVVGYQCAACRTSLVSTETPLSAAKADPNEEGAR